MRVLERILFKNLKHDLKFLFLYVDDASEIVSSDDSENNAETMAEYLFAAFIFQK